MRWNYRIVRLRDGSGCALHEVHYDEYGTPVAMKEGTKRFVCGPNDRPDVIIDALALAHADAIRWPVMDEPPVWALEEHGD